MKKKLISALLAVSMTMSLGAFAALAEETTEDASGDYGTVTIEDGEQTLTFTEMPKGILCAYSGESLMKLGLEDKIVATSENNKGRLSPIEGVAEKFKGIPELARSHENAVASGADLIIGEISAFKEDRWGTFDQLEEKGIHGYALTGTVVDDETMDSINTFPIYRTIEKN